MLAGQWTGMHCIMCDVYASVCRFSLLVSLQLDLLKGKGGGVLSYSKKKFKNTASQYHKKSPKFLATFSEINLSSRKVKKLTYYQKNLQIFFVFHV